MVLVERLVEREEALTRLAGLLADARDGRGRVALVGGAVATGKSALLHVLAERAAGLGALPVTALGSPVERDLPFGVLGQLLHDAPLPAADRERARALLGEGAHAVASAAPETATLGQMDAALVHALCGALIDLSERHPLLIAVDDVHHADRASLLCLAYLARRVRFARIAAVFSHADHGPHAETFFETELPRLPHCRRVRLTPLSREGVRELAARQVGAETAARLALRWYTLSGGNPLLAAALLDDHRDAVRVTGSERQDEAVAAGRYGRAVLSCLHRAEPGTLRVARALAVLGGPGAPGVPDGPAGAAALLGIPPEHARRAIHALAYAGLLDEDGAFRHPAATAAVLAELTPPERTLLYGRAAELAHAAGAPTTVVAEHLRNAGPHDVRRPGRPWVVPVLQDAARQSLREGAVEAAVAYLRLARAACADEQERVKITTVLVQAEWRINPGAPVTHFAELTDAMHRGHLRGGDAVVLARALLWHGRHDEAREVLERLGECADPHDRETAAELAVVRPWLRCSHPAFLACLRRPGPAQQRATMPSVGLSRRLQAASALATVLTRGPRADVAGAVERVLRGSRPDEMSMDTVENALLALTYGGHPERAEPWCDRFAEDAATRNAPGRRARLAAIRAEIALRRGDLPAAERHAAHALEIIPIPSWGVAVGAPLATLVLAATAMGRYEVGGDHLDRPVPDAMFHTRYGLHYLHARAAYELATGHLALALRDFELCGELMERWGLDVPGLVPWRAGAAETLLRMGRHRQARRLIEDQLARCSGAPRVQGMTLRLRAAAGEPRHRAAPLRQAADLLQSSGGDRYELARVLADLSAALQEAGESRRAGMIARRARALAEECAAEPLTRTLATPPPRPLEPGPSRADALLSEAERRVAALAAIGYTNREIADRLYVTVSTVEAHLTRTYRKLNIKRRAGLPASLLTGDP
ncbi:DNA-binding CsgD family transcriptional regulator [Thermocatellispora tengchongensis]|uniref:DNA-binding CsgD family transcriptional regulator n=1 Tax=Thermocatellispora tengchongensis TaxID=1073253 RepID=A0A840PG44_9ACTN|nr:LuxR family transcriptional regulator [Thermocatellispora tengchongensis]MBB5138122.1 DNA-binding CsgD family transcriptional regulator [Thermocatellispora tengchongensis]